MNIAITGEGILCAIGADKASVLGALQRRESGVTTMCHLRSQHHELPVGEVKMSDDEMKSLLGIDSSQEVSRTALMGMLAVRQALEDAGYFSAENGNLSPLKIVLISGTTVAGMDVTERHFTEMRTSDDHLSCLDYHSCGDNTRQIAEFFGCFSEYTTVSTACSSAANALILGAEMLKAGEADIVVAGGTEALSVFHLNGFNSLMILDKERCRPFDDRRAGLNLGEVLVNVMRLSTPILVAMETLVMLITKQPRQKTGKELIWRCRRHWRWRRYVLRISSTSMPMAQAHPTTTSVRVLP